MSSEPEAEKPSTPVSTGKGPNRVVIVGEQVDLTDGSEKAMAPMIVNFKDYYVPGDMTGPDTEKLRAALKRVFTNKNEPPPPCNASDKEVIIKSLEWRLSKLREERNTASKNKDTAKPRTITDHIRRLCAFVDKFKNAVCDDQGLVYNEAGLGELTDTTVDTLLKQFIFVMLQAHVPIEDYKQFTQEAKDIIRKVGKMPSDLDEIIRKFEGKIPNRIKELIACMKMVPLNTIEKMVQNEIAILLNRIIEKLKTVIDKEDKFWKVIGTQPTIEGIVDALLGKINELKGGPGIPAGQGTQIQVLTAEIERLKKLLESLQNNNTELLDLISKLEGEISKLRSGSTDPEVLRKLQERNIELERLLEVLGKENEAYKAKLLLTLTPEQIAELKAKLESLQGEYDKLLELKNSLFDRLKELERKTSESADPALANANKLLREALEKLIAKNQELQSLIDSLEKQLADLQNKHNEKIKELENQLQQLEGNLGKSSTDTSLEQLKKKDDELEAEIAKLEAQLAKLKADHEAEVAPLKAEILSLKAQNAAYAGQMAELQKLNLQLQAEIDRLIGLLAKKEAEMNGVVAAKKVLEDEKADLLSKLAELSSEISGLKERISLLITHYNDKIAALEAELAKKNAELASLKSGATTSQLDEAELKGRLAGLEKDAEELKKRIAELTEQHAKEKAELQKQLDEKDAELRALKAGSAASQAELEKLEKEITEMKKRLAELTVQYEATKAALDEAILKFESIGPLLDAILEDLEKIKSEKNAEITALKEEVKKCADTAAQLARLQTEKAGLEEQLRDLTGTISGFTPTQEKARLFDYLLGKTGELETKLKVEGVNQQTIDAFIDALKAKEIELKKCGDDGEKVKAHIDAVTKELEEMKASLEAKKTNNTSSKTDLDAAKARVAELEGQLAAAGSSKTDVNNELQKEKAHVAELEGKLASAGASKTEVNSELQATRKALEEAIARVAELEAQLAAAKASKEGVDRELKAATDALDAAKAAFRANSELKNQAAIDKEQENKEKAQKMIDELIGKAEAAKAGIDELQAKLDEANKLKEELKRKLDTAESDLQKKINEAAAAAQRAEEAQRAAAAAAAGSAAAAAATAEAEAARNVAVKAAEAAKAEADRRVAEADQRVAEAARKAEEAAAAAAATGASSAERATAAEAAAAKKVAEAEAAAARKIQEATDATAAAKTATEAAEAAEAAKVAAVAAQTAAEATANGLKVELGKLQEQLKSCIDKQKLKTILQAIIENKDFESLGDKDINNKLKTLRYAIYLKEYIAYMISNIDTPETIKEPPSELKPLVDALQNVKQIKEEKTLQESCYLYFFASHVQVTHFPTDNDRSKKISEKYESIVNDLLDTTKNKMFEGNIENLINALLPILRFMEIIYMSKKKLAFKFIRPPEFPPNFLTILKALLDKNGAPTFDINKNFSIGTTGTDNNPLENIYILEDKVNNSFQIVNAEPIRNVGRSGRVPPPVQAAHFPDQSILDGNYSKLERDLIKIVDTAVGSSEKIENIDTTFTYPVLFYLLIFSLKKYLNPSKGILKGNKCLLPKILQLPPVPKEQ